MENEHRQEEYGKKRGRPRKKQYSREFLAQELLDAVTEIYREKQEIKATAAEFSLPPHKVKKLLITNKVVTYPETEQIQRMLGQGKSMKEIQEIMGLSYSTINTYLPYSKAIYHLTEKSQNAERVERYRERKKAISTLAVEPGCGNLWKAVVAFQGYLFTTAKGLKFSYTVKGGELYFSRKEKSITISTVELAYKRAVEMGGIVTGPKKLGVFGASYLFSVFVRLGVIRL